MRCWAMGAAAVSARTGPAQEGSRGGEKGEWAGGEMASGPNEEERAREMKKPFSFYFPKF